MKKPQYRIANVVMQGNEHGKLAPNVIYAELVSIDDGKAEICSTLGEILEKIRDRELSVEGVRVETKMSRGTACSFVSLDL